MTTVKPKDYELAEVVEAESPYAVWEKLKQTDRPLQVGDILQIEDGELRICKYVGFEEAQWFLPEPIPDPAAQMQSVPPEVR